MNPSTRSTTPKSHTIFLFFFIAALCNFFSTVSSFTPPNTNLKKHAPCHASLRHDDAIDDVSSIGGIGDIGGIGSVSERHAPSRRKFLMETILSPAATTLIAASTTTVTAFPGPASAAYPQEAEDKQKVIKGYQRLEYLLDNWEKETTFCKNKDNPYIGCDRSPEKVMEYLGYKSMNDPLFRADKTLRRLQTLVPEENEKDQDDFDEALNVFVEKAEEGNGYAYISSWGEANPGGGKDRVALFIERSKNDVIEAKQSLATIIRILKL